MNDWRVNPYIMPKETQSRLMREHHVKTLKELDMVLNKVRGA
jgi:hypothetical protein